MDTIQPSTDERDIRRCEHNAAGRRVRELIADAYAAYGRHEAGLDSWGVTDSSIRINWELNAVVSDVVTRCLHVNTRSSRTHVRRILDALDAYEDADCALHQRRA